MHIRRIIEYVISEFTYGFSINALAAFIAYMEKIARWILMNCRTRLNKTIFSAIFWLDLKHGTIYIEKRYGAQCIIL